MRRQSLKPDTRPWTRCKPGVVGRGSWVLGRPSFASGSRYSFAMQGIDIETRAVRRWALCSLKGMATGMALLLAGAVWSAGEASPTRYLQLLDESLFLQRVEAPIDETVRNHLVALGAMQKVRGVWAPRQSERISGQRLAYTWKVEEGFTVRDALDELEAAVGGDDRLSTLYACEAVSCGSSVQWANRVFRERLLYGTQASQVYRAYTISGDAQPYRLLFYGAARTNERQYVRAELFVLEDGSP